MWTYVCLRVYTWRELENTQVYGDCWLWVRIPRVTSVFFLARAQGFCFKNSEFICQTSIITTT